MKGYTIILTSPKLAIPSDGIVAFIIDLIKSNLLNIYHFGGEMDNQLDYTDESIDSFVQSTTFITLSFDANEFNPDDLTELEKFKYTIKLLTERDTLDIHTDEKDILIFL